MCISYGRERFWSLLLEITAGEDGHSSPELLSLGIKMRLETLESFLIVISVLTATSAKCARLHIIILGLWPRFETCSLKLTLKSFYMLLLHFCKITAICYLLSHKKSNLHRVQNTEAKSLTHIQEVRRTSL